MINLGEIIEYIQNIITLKSKIYSLLLWIFLFANNFLFICYDVWLLSNAFQQDI